MFLFIVLFDHEFGRILGRKFDRMIFGQLNCHPVNCAIVDEHQFSLGGWKGWNSWAWKGDSSFNWVLNRRAVEFQEKMDLRFPR